MIVPLSPMGQGFLLAIMTSPALNAFLAARREMADVLSAWANVRSRTAEVADYAVRFLAAEVSIPFLMSWLLLSLFFQFALDAFAAAAGSEAVAEYSDQLRTRIRETRDCIRTFALEPWLERFPGFVDDLAPRLRTYAQALHSVEVNVLEDNPEDIPPNPCAPYWSLLTQLRLEQGSGSISTEDYEWYRARALLAISELSAVDPTDSSPAPIDVDTSSSSTAAPPVPPSLPGVQTLPSTLESSDLSPNRGSKKLQPRARAVTSGAGPSATAAGLRVRSSGIARASRHSARRGNIVRRFCFRPVRLCV